MQYSPLPQDVHTLYVPQDFVDRVAARALSGDLFPDLGRVPARVLRRDPDFVRVEIWDDNAGAILGFNRFDVWRRDNQTIQFRSWCRPAPGARLQAWRRFAPAPPMLLLMVPVTAALAFLAPELLLMPVIGLGVARRGPRKPVQPLDRQLKAIADGAA